MFQMSQQGPFYGQVGWYVALHLQYLLIQIYLTMLQVQLLPPGEATLSRRPLREAMRARSERARRRARGQDVACRRQVHVRGSLVLHVEPHHSVEHAAARRGDAVVKVSKRERVA